MGKDKDLKLEQQCECGEECTCDEQEGQLTEEELLELLGRGDVLKLDTDNVSDIELCEECFEQGVHDVSETCGKLSALMSIGLTSAEALDLVLNQINIEYNLELTKMNNYTQLEIAKVQGVAIDQARI